MPSEIKQQYYDLLEVNKEVNKGVLVYIHMGMEILFLGFMIGLYMEEMIISGWRQTLFSGVLMDGWGEVGQSNKETPTMSSNWWCLGDSMDSWESFYGLWDSFEKNN